MIGCPSEVNFLQGGIKKQLWLYLKIYHIWGQYSIALKVYTLYKQVIFTIPGQVASDISNSMMLQLSK